MQYAVPPLPEKTSEKVNGVRGDGVPVVHDLHLQALISAGVMCDIRTFSQAAWNHSAHDQQRIITPDISSRHQQYRAFRPHRQGPTRAGMAY